MARGRGCTPLVGVDADGTVTTAWSEADGSETVIATWLPAAPWPSLSTLGQFSSISMTVAPVVVTELAVTASGAAVLAGTSGLADVAVAYRASAGGAFDFTVEAGTMVSPARDPHVAINAAGAAVLLYRQGDTIWASRRPSALASFGATEAVNAGFAAANSPADLSVALDPAGNTVAAFTLRATAGPVVGSAWSPPGGAWAVQWPLSPGFLEPQGPDSATGIRVLVNASGVTALVWQQLVANESSPQFIDVRLGSSATGAWGALETAYQASFALLSGKSYPPGAALTANGTLTVASETRADLLLGAVVRTRAPDGTWGALRTVAPLHTVQSPLSVGADDRGHIAVATAPDDGPSRKVVLVSVFDPVAPLVSPIAVTGTRLAGDPVSSSHR